MIVRIAEQRDVEAIYRLGRGVDEFKVSDQTVDFWPKSILAKAIEDDDVLVLVAEDEDIVGFLIANCNQSLRKVIIENVYVLPPRRSQGVGDMLVARLLAVMVEAGYEYGVALVPPQASGAIDLYQRNGFSRGEVFAWLDKVLADDFKR